MLPNESESVTSLEEMEGGLSDAWQWMPLEQWYSLQLTPFIRWEIWSHWFTKDNGPRVSAEKQGNGH